MVVFTCQHCNSCLKKSVVEKHYTQKCRKTPNLTCIDCLKDFIGKEYVEHTACLTEAEKYGGEGYVAKRVAVKQNEWLEIFSRAIQNPHLTTEQRTFLESFSDFQNVPRIRKKFHNFARNVSRRLYSKELSDSVFDILEEAYKEEKKTTLHSNQTDKKMHISRTENEGNFDNGSQKCKETESPKLNGVTISEKGKIKKKEKQSKLREFAENEVMDDEDNTTLGLDISTGTENKINGDNGEGEIVGEKKKKKKKKSENFEGEEGNIEISKYNQGICNNENDWHHKINEGHEQENTTEKKKKKKVKKEPNGKHNVDEKNGENENYVPETNESVGDISKVIVSDVKNSKTNGNDMEAEKTLSKKEKKKKLKQEKYQQELNFLQNLKKNEHDENEEDIDKVENGENLRKKEKKRKRKYPKSECENIKSKKMKNSEEKNNEEMALSHSTLHPIDIEHPTEDLMHVVPKKFNWEEVILEVLNKTSDKEMSLKKLRKKVVSEYQYRKGFEGNYEETMAKFNKKIHKTIGVKILKDRAILKSC